MTIGEYRDGMCQNQIGDLGVSTLPGLDFMLGDEFDMLRDTVASFASKEIAPRAV